MLKTQENPAVRPPFTPTPDTTVENNPLHASDTTTAAQLDEDDVFEWLESTPQETVDTLIQAQTEEAGKYYVLLSTLLPYGKSSKPVEGHVLHTDCLRPIAALIARDAYKKNEKSNPNVLEAFDVEITNATIGENTGRNMLVQLEYLASIAGTERAPIELDAEIQRTLETFRRLLASAVS